jgi:hypothetical protein
MVLLYEFVNFLEFSADNDEIPLINEFFKNLTDNEKNKFFDIPMYSGFNFLIVRSYLAFIASYINFFRKTNVFYIFIFS